MDQHIIVLVCLSDVPEVYVDVLHPSDAETGWLNCTVSSKPTSNITLYRMTPLPVVIVDNIVRGDNFLTFTVDDVHKYEGVYRCTADNGLGVVVNSDVRQKRKKSPCLSRSLNVFVYHVNLNNYAITGTGA